jgi:hypothetical protein
MVSKHLGTLIVTSDGEGHWTIKQKSVPLRIEVSIDPMEIERGPNGTILYAYCTFRGYFQSKHWNVYEDGLLYTDKQVQAQVNAWLANMNYGGKVYWSEQGRQDVEYVDFDMDYRLLPQIFPELNLQACAS